MLFPISLTTPTHPRSGISRDHGVNFEDLKEPTIYHDRNSQANQLRILRFSRYVNWLAAGSGAITDGLPKSRARLSEDDHQIPHGDFDGVQPVLSTGEDRTTIPLFLAWQCARNHEDQYEDFAEDIEGEELCPGQIQYVYTLGANHSHAKGIGNQRRICNKTSTNIMAEDGKEMKLDSEQLGIKGVMEELDRHSRILARQEELTGN